MYGEIVDSIGLFRTWTIDFGIIFDTFIEPEKIMRGPQANIWQTIYTLL